jgi:dipeptidyl aminopeptidase/acylaminoacyl peptidase
VFAFPLKKDKTVPVAESERLIEAVRNAGGNTRLTVLSGEGHNICKLVCDRSDLWEWLFQHRRSK